MENAPSPKYFSDRFSFVFSTAAVGSINSILCAGVNANEDAKPDVAVPETRAKLLSLGALTKEKKMRW